MADCDDAGPAIGLAQWMATARNDHRDGPVRACLDVEGACFGAAPRREPAIRRAPDDMGQFISISSEVDEMEAAAGDQLKFAMGAMG